jgi:hypothetical protein
MKTCWTITDDLPGTKSQVIGLAEAIGLPTIHKTCKRKWPWGWLSLDWGNPLNQLTDKSDPLNPPWPDLVISCGRRSAPLALSIKKQNGGKTFCVHIQDPIINRPKFDLIVAPEHDNLTGPNVISSKGAIHKITKAKLEEGIQEYGHLFNDLPRPYNTVLLGGNTNRYKMTLEAMNELIDAIVLIQEKTKGSVLVTPSFRTPFRDVLRDKLSSKPNIFLADIERLNPYLAMLALADTLFATDDSVNMVCEACYTGKPVYLLSLKGHGETKPKKFFAGLVDEGILRVFEGEIESWTYTPFNDTERIAKVVRARMEL